ncbi:MAG: type III-A CRISPR-associated RAMP protein Csm4 [Armatimonadota bacterium]|nr:type III-A CRISPR-associated RAMP protein Csm4 [Armatimonadota bacterium]MDR7432865.1 type III-A CRISPR-associated RAMP protein Csm4 [Armatimonadota bacterium]MDR7515627.1 type III-A CRISPR-associated RAMP protein Csm4 [Armatimonadota bacterium]MDR7602856.1 type III-A CRISPR-associated RAMP protein Csm4 [Armatimonadota bacterium]MDR7610119.1 type III-A CRISPR-associated RAMP protein Csm4 [Armatimonadota bacterium]
MSLYSVSLVPRGAFHLGERGIGYEETSELVHADTLFGALCSVWALVFGEDAVQQDLLPDGPDWGPPFLITSAFPRAGPVRFYPKPVLPPPRGDPARWKDVQWISEALFCAWLGAGGIPEFETIHGGTVALTGAEREKVDPHHPSLLFWKAVRVPRVTLDAVSNASELWHFGRLHFAPGCGLHFWVELRRLEDRFWTALRLLGDVGLGGDRSSGHGLFSVEFRREDPPWKASDSRFVTLSPVYLTQAQAPTLLRDGCAYRLETRTGWIGSTQPSPYRRKAVRLLAEGSVLTGPTSDLWGALVDVSPGGVPDLPHRVYRWGYAFPAGVNRT